MILKPYHTAFITAANTILLLLEQEQNPVSGIAMPETPRPVFTGVITPPTVASEPVTTVYDPKFSIETGTPKSPIYEYRESSPSPLYNEGRDSRPVLPLPAESP